MKLDKILVPLDGSMLAETALPAACGVAGTAGAAISLLRAAEATTLPGSDKIAAQVKALSVLVNADGRYFVDEHEVLRTDIDALKQTLEQVAGSDRARPVLLRADARTPHQAVVTALDALGQLGFRKINIATAPEAQK